MIDNPCFVMYNFSYSVFPRCEMRQNIGEVLRNPGRSLRMDCTADMSDIDYFGEQVFPSPVSLTGEVRNRAGLVTFEGTVRAEGTVSCARCLAPARVVRELPLSLTITEDPEEGETDEEYVAVKADILDLHDVVRDELILSLDMVTLCSPDCRGLCPKCGKNLNAGDCDCPAREPDPRFAVLGELLKRQQEEQK